MLQVGCAPVIVSITFPFCSWEKVERRNCSEIAITGDASAASAFVFPVMCPNANFKAECTSSEEPGSNEMDGDARVLTAVKSTTSENLQRTMSEPFDIPILLDKTRQGTWPHLLPVFANKVNTELQSRMSDAFFIIYFLFFWW